MMIAMVLACRDGNRGEMGEAMLRATAAGWRACGPVEVGHSAVGSSAS